MSQNCGCSRLTNFKLLRFNTRWPPPVNNHLMLVHLVLLLQPRTQRCCHVSSSVLPAGAQCAWHTQAQVCAAGVVRVWALLLRYVASARLAVASILCMRFLVACHCWKFTVHVSARWTWTLCQGAAATAMLWTGPKTASLHTSNTAKARAINTSQISTALCKVAPAHAQYPQHIKTSSASTCHQHMHPQCMDAQCRAMYSFLSAVLSSSSQRPDHDGH